MNYVIWVQPETTIFIVRRIWRRMVWCVVHNGPTKGRIGAESYEHETVAKPYAAAKNFSTPEPTTLKYKIVQ